MAADEYGRLLWYHTMLASPKPETHEIATGPVPASARIELIDIIRGFALFGVLAANMTIWYHPRRTGLDTAVRDLIRLLLENKSWPLFCLLFGLGVAMQFERERPLPVHLRRMFALFGFGLIVFVVFSGNAILINYSVMGVVLLLFRRLSTRSLLPFAFAFVLASAAAPLYRSMLPGVERRQAQEAARRRLSKEGTMFEVAAQRLDEVPWILAGQRFQSQSRDFAMVLVGFWVGRRRLHHQVTAHRSHIKRILFWALPVGLAGTLAAWKWTSTQWPLAVMIPWDAGTFLAADMQSVGYAAALIILTERPAFYRILRPLASVGRMSLTNFLLQFLILRILFDRFFLQLDWGQAACFGITISLFALQVLGSCWWMRRFAMGPAEWLWRIATYGRAPQIRLGHASS